MLSEQVYPKIPPLKQNTKITPIPVNILGQLWISSKQQSTELPS